MNILKKIIAALAVIIGLLATVIGTRVLLGLFDPGYQYFTALIIYNIIAGLASIYAGYLIWRNNKNAFTWSSLIFSAHLIVLILLKTVYADIISSHSVGAMTFRSASWLVITIILWFANKK